MAFALVQNTQNTVAASLSLTLTWSTTPVAGNLMVAVITKDDDDAITSFTTGWTEHAASSAGYAATRTNIYVRTAGAAESLVFEVGGDVEAYVGTMFELSGASAVEAYSYSRMSSLTPQNAAVTTSASAALLVAVVGYDNSATVTMNAGMTQIGSSLRATGNGGCGQGISYLTAGAAGSYGPYVHALTVARASDLPMLVIAPKTGVDPILETFTPIKGTLTLDGNQPTLSTLLSIPKSFAPAKGTLTVDGNAPTFAREVVKTFYPSLENRLPYSEDFDNPAWAWQGTGSATLTAMSAPKGVEKVYKLTDASSATGKAYIQDFMPVIPLEDDPYTFSVHLKKGDSDRTRIIIYYVWDTNIYSGLDVWWGVSGTATISGAFGTSATGGLVDSGDGWYRAYVKRDHDGNPLHDEILARIFPAGYQISSTGIGTYVYAAGAQVNRFGLEEYRRTEGSAFAIDSLRITGNAPTSDFTASLAESFSPAKGSLTLNGLLPTIDVQTGILRSFNPTQAALTLSGNLPAFERLVEKTFRPTENFFPNSEEVELWAKNAATASATNVVKGPDGEQNMDKLDEQAVLTLHQAIDYFYLNPSRVHTGSMYFQKEERKRVSLLMRANTPARHISSNYSYAIVDVNLSSGSVLSTSIWPASATVNVSIVDYGISAGPHDLYRVWMTAATDTDAEAYGNTSASCGLQCRFRLDDGTQSYLGVEGEGMYVGYAQVNYGGKIPYSRNSSGNNTHNSLALAGSQPSFSFALTQQFFPAENRLAYSNQFDTGWNLFSCSVAKAPAITDPFGGNDAWKLSEPSGLTTDPRINKQWINEILRYTGSVYLMAAERSIAVVHLDGILAGFTKATAEIDLTTGAVTGNADAELVGAIDAGGGWWRVYVQDLATGIAAPNLAFGPREVLGNDTYTGDGSSGIYVYGAQVNRGTLQDYIETDDVGVSTRLQLNGGLPTFAKILYAPKTFSPSVGSLTINGHQVSVSLQITLNAQAGPASLVIDGHTPAILTALQVYWKGKPDQSSAWAEKADRSSTWSSKADASSSWSEKTDLSSTWTEKTDYSATWS